MPSNLSISGQQVAAIFLMTSSIMAWIFEMLRLTIYDGKAPGVYMPGWMSTTWMLCLLGSPIVSFILALIVSLDHREKITPNFTAAIACGCSPVLILAGHLFAFL